MVAEARGERHLRLALRSGNRDQAAELEVSLSILSPPQPIDLKMWRWPARAADKDGRLSRPVLPQVPIEHKWESVAFSRTRPAGKLAARDAWQTGAQVEALHRGNFGRPRCRNVKGQPPGTGNCMGRTDDARMKPQTIVSVSATRAPAIRSRRDD